MKSGILQLFRQTEKNFEKGDFVFNEDANSEIERFCKHDIHWNSQEITRNESGEYNVTIKATANAKLAVTLHRSKSRTAKGAAGGGVGGAAVGAAAGGGMGAGIGALIGGPIGVAIGAGVGGGIGIAAGGVVGGGGGGIGGAVAGRM